MTLTFATGPVHLDEEGESLRRRFAMRLVDVLHRPVRVLAATSYAEVGRMLAEGEADFAWVPPAIYVRQDAKGELTLLCRVDRTGGAGYRGVLFVPADSAAQSAADLAGTRIAWVDEHSCAGHLFVRLALQREGIDVAAHFASQAYCGSHGSAVRAVMRGEADAGATHANVDADGALLLAGWQPYAGKAAMRALLVSDAIPPDVLCAAKSLDPDALDELREALLCFHEAGDGDELLDELFGGPRLVPCTKASYDPVREALAL